ncbi:MAG: hypothetical protein PHU23_06005 [Dehalococcoidales bacterium]|nr:hypothetical protein [Dehalococcoidales bacterium]
MSLLPRLPKFSDILADNPIHRGMQDLQGVVRTAKEDLNSLACSLKVDNSNCVLTTPVKTEAPQKQPKNILENISTAFEVPTEAETLTELKKRLVKEIAKAENDLTNGLKINNKPCSCMSNKHNVVIESLAEEIMPKDSGNPLYRQIVDWFDSHESQMTVQAVASGQYAEQYAKFAGDLGEFRRRLSKNPSPVKPVQDFLKDKEG